MLYKITHYKAKDYYPLQWNDIILILPNLFEWFGAQFNIINFIARSSIVSYLRSNLTGSNILRSKR